MWPNDPMRSEDGVLNIKWEQFAKKVREDDIFLEKFPDLKDDIIKYRRNPGCAPCAKVLNKISKQSEKLIDIYGDNIKILPRKEPVKFKRSLVKEIVELDEIDNALERISRVSGPQVPSICPIDPDHKSYMIVYTKPIRIN